MRDVFRRADGRGGDAAGRCAKAVAASLSSDISTACYCLSTRRFTRAPEDATDARAPPQKKRPPLVLSKPLRAVAARARGDDAFVGLGHLRAAAILVGDAGSAVVVRAASELAAAAGAAAADALGRERVEALQRCRELGNVLAFCREPARGVIS